MPSQVFHCRNSNLEPYKCVHCIYKTSNLVDLKTHKCSQRSSRKNTQPLTCPKCNFKTFSNLILLKHVSDYCKHAEWFRCLKCSFKTGRLSYLTRHKNNKHTAKVKTHWFQCEQCPFKSIWKDSVKKHTISKHTEERVFIRCPDCPYSSICKKSVQKHIKSKHSHVTAPKWIQCEQCPFKTLHSDSLKRHRMGLHRDESEIDWHKCPLCTFQTKRVDNLKRHQREQHFKGGIKRRKKDTTKDMETIEFVESPGREYKLICELCSYTTTRKDSLKRHMTSRHRDKKETQWYRCESCDFKTKRVDNLKRHQQDKHGQKKIVPIQPAPVNEFVDVFTTIKAEPEELPSGDPLLVSSITADLAKPLENTETWVKCELCPYMALRKDLIHRHMLSSHKDKEKIKWLHCKTCNFKTKRKDQLQRHQKDKHSVSGGKEEVPPPTTVHLDQPPVIKPRKILPLPKSTGKKQLVATKSDLMPPSKTDEKWYSCDLCPFSATLERSLKIHQQSHSSKNENIYFKCALCPLKTTRKDSLRRHIRETHIEWSSEQVMKASESPNALNFPKFYCDKCSYSTEWEKSLGVHYLLKHRNERILQNLLQQ